MNKVVFTLILMMILIGCNLNESQDADKESIVDVDFSEVGERLTIDIDSTNVNEIIIRTTMTDEHPSVKVLLQRSEIDDLINLLNNLEGEKVADDNSNGWQYWILLDGYSISIMGNRFVMNNEVYKIDSLFYIKIKELYNNSIEEAKKYP